MAGEPYITVVGNLAGDPELRFTANGHAVANFTIAQTPRSFDRQSNQWVDEETLWVRASIWREAAENVAETLTKGMRVIAHGRLRARSFETKTGEQRTNWELEVEEIGPSLRWATAQVNRKNANGGIDPYASNQGSGWGQQQGQPHSQNQGSGWSQPNNQAAQQGAGWGQAQGQPASQPQGQTQGQPAQQNTAANPSPFQGQDQVLSQGQGPWAGQNNGGQDEPPPF